MPLPYPLKPFLTLTSTVMLGTAPQRHGVHAPPALGLAAHTLASLALASSRRLSSSNHGRSASFAGGRCP